MNLPFFTFRPLFSALLLLCLMALSACQSTKAKRKIHKVKDVDSVAVKASQDLLKPVGDITYENPVIIIAPFVNGEGKKSHLGKKLASQIGKKVSFKGGHEILEKNWKGLTYNQYGVAHSLLCDYVIAGKVETKEVYFEITLDFYNVATKERIPVSTLYMDLDDHLVKLNKLHLPEADLPGYARKEGFQLLGQRVIRELYTLEEVRRVVVMNRKESKWLTEFQKDLFDFLSHPKRYGKRAKLWPKEKKSPPLPSGKEVILQVHPLPYGRDRNLLTVILTTREISWRSVLKIIVQKGAGG